MMHTNKFAGSHTRINPSDNVIPMTSPTRPCYTTRLSQKWNHEIPSSSRPESRNNEQAKRLHKFTRALDLSPRRWLLFVALFAVGSQSRTRARDSQFAGMGGSLVDCRLSDGKRAYWYPGRIVSDDLPAPGWIKEEDGYRKYELNEEGEPDLTRPIIWGKDFNGNEIHAKRKDKPTVWGMPFDDEDHPNEIKVKVFNDKKGYDMPTRWVNVDHLRFEPSHCIKRGEEIECLLEDKWEPVTVTEVQHSMNHRVISVTGEQTCGKFIKNVHNHNIRRKHTGKMTKNEQESLKPQKKRRQLAAEEIPHRRNPRPTSAEVALGRLLDETESQ